MEYNRITRTLQFDTYTKYKQQLISGLQSSPKHKKKEIVCLFTLISLINIPLFKDCMTVFSPLKHTITIPFFKCHFFINFYLKNHTHTHNIHAIFKIIAIHLYGKSALNVLSLQFSFKISCHVITQMELK